MNGHMPADQAARDRVLTALDETLVVEAGAGTGKTRALVDRVLRLILVAGVPLRDIAAITFTEAAAAELRDRIRAGLEHARRTGTAPGPGAVEESLDPTAHERLAQALGDLDDATITTLHGFAQRLLVEHPLEAGLPPRFSVRDDIESSVAFEERWDTTLDHILDNPGVQPAIVRGIAIGLGLQRFHEIAAALHEQWHRLRSYSAPDADDALAPVDVTGVIDPLRAAVAMRNQCTSATDRLVARFDEYEAFIDELANAPTDDARLARLAAGAPLKVKGVGNKQRWRNNIDDVRNLVMAAGTERERILAAERARVLTAVLQHLVAAELAAADERRRTGELDFHDLLVLARDLLAQHREVREALRTRYARVMVDEFQDTDPLQIEIAVLLTAADPATAGTAPWHETPVEPGRLFVVGDPKQSIYRFRHADIALYQQVLSVHGEHRVHLTTNFRSTSDVIDWVNAVFAALFSPDGVGNEHAGADHEATAASQANVVQAEFEPLVAMRPPATTGSGPAITVLGGATDDDLETLRVREASEIVATIEQITAQGWLVRRRQPGGDTAQAPAQLRDIAILLPTRTALRQIEDALDAAGIAYRVESKSLVYSTAEVSEILAVLAAIDDPTNEVALVAALRTPAFACADDELFEFRNAGGVWDYRAQAPATLPPDHPVVAAMSTLAGYHDARRWETVSALVDRVLRERRFYELALAARRPRDRWRRYRFLADQARAFCSNGGRDLRAFVAWAIRQSDERAAVSEVVAPESDDDAVRILTVHGSKGLEFPVVVLAGLNTERRADRPPVIFTRDGFEAGIGEFQTAEYGAALAVERAMAEAERVRLLYVAATRAEDHLVVSLHHKAKSSGTDAALILTATPGQSTGPPFDEASASGPVPARPHSRDAGSTAVPADSDPIAARDAWIASRAVRLAALRRAAFVAATGVATLGQTASAPPADAAPAVAPPPDGDAAPADGTDLDAATRTDVDDDDPGWAEAPDPPRRRGRAGTARGRAVHAVLQTVDLATGAGLEDAVRAQAEAEGIPDARREIEQLVRAALASPSVTAALAAPRRWRELAVATPVEGVVLEGFIDLLYQTAAGLTIVDYKTDQPPATETDRAALVAKYRLQLAAYAVAIEAVTGLPVTRAVLLFVGSGSAEEVDITDLDAARQDVRTTLAGEARRLAGLRARVLTNGATV